MLALATTVLTNSCRYHLRGCPENEAAVAFRDLLSERPKSDRNHGGLFESPGEHEKVDCDRESGSGDWCYVWVLRGYFQG